MIGGEVVRLLVHVAHDPFVAVAVCGDRHVPLAGSRRAKAQTVRSGGAQHGVFELTNQVGAITPRDALPALE